MRLTPAQLIDRRITPPNDRLTGQVVDVDYYAHQMTVVLDGQSRVRVLIPDHLAAVMGTAASPKVTPGSWVLVERVNDEYVGTAFIARTFLPFVGRGAAFGPGAPVTTTLAAPVWTSGYPKQIGVSVYGDWGVVPGASAYEIWQNTVASPNGATLVKGGIGTSSYNWTFNPGQTSELLVNGGFESGDFTGWTPRATDASILPWTVTSDAQHGGTFSAKSVIPATSTPKDPQLDTIYYAALPATNYALSFWYKITSVSGLAYRATVYYWDSGLNALSYTDLAGTYGAVIDWTQITASVTTPASTAYITVRFWMSTGGSSYYISFYLDDVSLLGPPPGAGSNLLYAIRAVDANGNAAPFSTWLTAPQQSARLGANSLAIDPITGRIHDDTAGAVPVVAIGSLGLTTTGWEVPLDNSTPTAVETWTYASSTTFTIPYDATARYSAGVRLRCKQGGAYKYFYCVGSAYSAPNTTVTVTGGSDYSLANAAITDNYYSYAAIAQGFPQWFNWTPTWGGFLIDPGGTNRFMIQGNTCFVERDPGSAGTSNATTCSLTVPVAAAVVSGRFLVMCYDNGAWLNNPGGNYIPVGSTTLTLFTTIIGGAWTGSGGKDTLVRGFYEF